MNVPSIYVDKKKILNNIGESLEGFSQEITLQATILYLS